MSPILAEMRRRGWAGVFSPATGKITIDTTRLKTCPYWRRQWIAILAHELCHAFDWHVTYWKDGEAWNNAGRRLEKRANKIQDLVLITLGIRP